MNENYFEVVNPEYVFLQIIPSVSLRNYNSDVLIPIISRLYLNFTDRIKTSDKKITFEKNTKLGYYIYLEKTDVRFYFVVPKKHYNLFKDKIIDIWSNRVTITKVDEIPVFSMDCTKYYLTYKRADALSLTCDKRNNTLLASQLNTLHVMEHGDKVGLFYNFIPTPQPTWKAKWDHAIKDMKNDIPTFHGRPSGKDILKLVGSLFVYLSDIVLGSITLSDKSVLSVPKKISELELSKSTINKRENYIVDTQIICLSESTDKDREKNNALVMCNSFECVNEDNTIIYRKISKRKNCKVNLLDTKIIGADTIKVQPKEAQNFISLPARELLEEHKVIAYTSVLETQVPELLQKGYIYLGENTYKGKQTPAYLRDNYDQGSMPLVLIGEQGSGKTTYISNYCKYALERNESIILIDFIKNCELADTVAKVVPKDRLIVIDMSDIKDVQGIGYNEITPKTDHPIDLMDIANRKSLYIQMLVDALNVDGDMLSSNMDRFLSAASNIVFLDNNASLKDVMKCLNDHTYRNFCIDAVPTTLVKMLEDEINALRELDELDSNGKPRGTKMVKIDGINHRINLLRKDFRLKTMFNRGTEENVNLVDVMNKGKVVLFKMPQEYFSTPYSKNVIVTYLFTKIWGASLIRGSKCNQPSRCHIMVDEVFQAKTAIRMLKEQETLPQTRKFGVKFVFSCQYLGQIDVINQTLKSAGASYMLMKGSGKSNFSELKDELYPYTLEDMEALPQYSSLNLINYEEGRVKFVTKLPKPLC